MGVTSKSAGTVGGNRETKWFEYFFSYGATSLFLLLESFCQIAEALLLTVTCRGSLQKISNLLTWGYHRISN